MKRVTILVNVRNTQNEYIVRGYRKSTKPGVDMTHAHSRAGLTPGGVGEAKEEVAAGTLGSMSLRDMERKKYSYITPSLGRQRKILLEALVPS